MKKKIALLLVCVMAITLIMAGCSTSNDDHALKVCVGPEPDTIDPALNSAVDGGTLIIHAFEGLMTLDKSGNIKEAQAEKYAVSDDGLTYTFTLREGLKWSDGKDLKASDYAYAWNRAVNPDTASDYENIFAPIKGYASDAKVKKTGNALSVAADDENRTLTVTLSAPCPYFLELCAFPTYMPVRKDIVEANPEGWAKDAKTYVGNGPYKMIEWQHSGVIKLAKNENYWNVKAIGPDQINFVLMEDDTAQLNAYNNNSLALIDIMPQAELDNLQKQSDFHKDAQLGTYYVSFNTKKAPLDNPKVRKALTLAVNREFIVKNISKSGEIPAAAYIPPSMDDFEDGKKFREVGGDYFNPTTYDANLAQAKQLLAEAGYPDGNGFPTIEYLTNVGTLHEQVAEALQKDWKELGINVTITKQEWSTFLNSRKDGNYFIARDGWLADYNDPISFLDMYMTDAGNNNAQWSNQEYDALIRKIQTSTDQQERMQLLHQAEKMLFSDDNFIISPLYYYVDIYLLKDSVQGFYASPLGFKYFMYVTQK